MKKTIATFLSGCAFAACLGFMPVFVNAQSKDQPAPTPQRADRFSDHAPLTIDYDWSE